MSSLPWRRAPALAVRLLTVLLLVWLGGSLAAEQLMLHPRHWTVGPTPAAHGMAYREVSFQDGAGLTLRGWWIPGTNHRTLVMIHGWTSSRREPMDKAGYLHDAGYNILVFDLRGHGLSDGSYTTMGWLEPDDVRAAVAFARSQDAGPVALIGYSMGAALAVEEGARNPDVKAVVEDSGYDTLANVVAARFQRLTGLPALPFALPLQALGELDLHMKADRVRPVDDAARLAKPLLVIIGTADTTVPPAEGLHLFHAAAGPAELLVIPGAGHVEGYWKDPVTYKRSVLDFLSQNLK